jgi:hypothetical protein
VPPLLSAEKPAPTPASPPAGSPDDVSKGVNPMFALLLVATIINWFVFFGISMYLGGDAVGILPSQDGFVVKSHGHHTAVSEAAWAFSLVYSTATLLGTPAIWISFGVWEACSGKKKLFTSPKVWVIGLFLLVWATGWYWGIGSSFYNSYNDWQKFKHAPPSVHSQQP